MKIAPNDLRDLTDAKVLLENPGLPARIANVVGYPIEAAIEMLPDSAQRKIGALTQSVLTHVLDIAVKTMDVEAKEAVSSPWWHKAAAVVSGGVGGFFGELALPIELPISTTIMLRSIADIAREKGEDLKLMESRLACLEVFALGGRSSKDDRGETAYFVVREALARSLTEAALHLTERGLATEGAPAVLQFISKIAARFAIPVSEKVIVQALPVIGAGTGAIINLAFIDHFQDVARGHFAVRRLERVYGREMVAREYDLLPK